MTGRVVPIDQTKVAIAFKTAKATAEADEAEWHQGEQKDRSSHAPLDRRDWGQVV